MRSQAAKAGTSTAMDGTRTQASKPGMSTAVNAGSVPAQENEKWMPNRRRKRVIKDEKLMIPMTRQRVKSKWGPNGQNRKRLAPYRC